MTIFHRTAPEVALPGTDGQLHFFDTRSGKRLLAVDVPQGELLQLAWGPHGHSLVYATRGGWNLSLRVWDVEKLFQAGLRQNTDLVWSDPDPTFNDPGVLRRITWSPDGSKIATQVPGGYRVWDANTLAIVSDMESLAEDVNFRPADLQFSPDGKRLVTSYGGVQLYDVQSGKRLWQCEPYGSFAELDGFPGATSAVWSPEGDRIAVAGLRKPMIILDAETGDRVPDTSFETRQVNFVTAVHTLIDWSHFGLYWPDINYGVNRWRPGMPPERLAGVNMNAKCHMAVSPDGKKLACPGSENEIKILNLNHLGWEKILRGNNSRVTSVAWSFDGSRLLSHERDGVVRVWSPEHSLSMATITGVAGADWDPQGPRLAVCDARGSLRIYDATPSYEQECPPEFLPVIEKRLAADPTDAMQLKRKAIILCRQYQWATAAKIYQQLASRDSESSYFMPGWWAVNDIDAEYTDWTSIVEVPDSDLQEALKWYAPTDPANGFVEFHLETPYLLSPFYSASEQTVNLVVDPGYAEAAWLNGVQIVEKYTDQPFRFTRQVQAQGWLEHAGRAA